MSDNNLPYSNKIGSKNVKELKTWYSLRPSDFDALWEQHSIHCFNFCKCDCNAVIITVDAAAIFTWPKDNVIINCQLKINILVYCANIATDLSIEAKNNQQTHHFKTHKHSFRVLQFFSFSFEAHKKCMAVFSLFLFLPFLN